jgi:hypothetical protein
MRPAVPVGQEKNPLLSRGVEAGQKVLERERVALSRHVLPSLHYQSIGSLAEQAVKPGGHLLVGLGARDPGPVPDLLLDITEGSLAVELTRGASFFPTGEQEEENGKDGKDGKAHQARLGMGYGEKGWAVS